LPQAGPPTVTVLEAGQEPRKPLRYAFKKAAETTLMDMKMELQITGLGAQSPKVTMPTIRMTFDMKPQSVDADGTLTSQMEMKKVDILADKQISADMKDKLAKEMNQFVGLKGRTVVTSRGVTKEATVEVPPGASQSAQQLMDSIKDSLRNMSSPFPEEAVGKGAKWEVKTVVAGVMTIVETATYTLKDVSDKTATFDIAVQQTAPPQPMKPTMPLPKGTTMSLKSHEAKGKGDKKISLDRVTPVSNLKINSKSEMEVAVPQGDRQRIGLSMTLELAVKPKP
jgi:hypothetical protein